MLSSCSGLCRTKSQEASALALKHEEVEWIGTDILYSSDLLTLLFPLLLSSRSQKRDVDKNPEEADSASDNDVLSEKEDDDESKGEEQLRAEHMVSQKEHFIEISKVVRKTIFPEIKFANNEKFFAYQPVRDETDGSVGMLFRRIRSKVATVGADEETWWIGMKKAVKDALQKKRGTVCQAIKMAILGKLKRVLAGRDQPQLTHFACYVAFTMI